MPFAAASDFTAIPRWSMVNMTFVVLPRRGKTASLGLATFQFADNLFNQRVWVAPVLGDLGRIAGYLTVGQMSSGFVEHSIAQHFQQAFLPVLDVVLENKVLLLKERFVLRDCRRQFLHAGA